MTDNPMSSAHQSASGQGAIKDNFPMCCHYTNAAWRQSGIKPLSSGVTITMIYGPLKETDG